MSTQTPFCVGLTFCWALAATEGPTAVSQGYCTRSTLCPLSPRLLSSSSGPVIRLPRYVRSPLRGCPQHVLNVGWAVSWQHHDPALYKGGDVMSPIHRDFLAPPPPIGDKPLNNNQLKALAYQRAHPKDLGAPTEAEHAHVKHMAESVMCKDVPFPILREHNWRNDLANRLVETAGIPVLRIWCVHTCNHLESISCMPSAGASRRNQTLHWPNGTTVSRPTCRASKPLRLGGASKPCLWLCRRSPWTSPERLLVLAHHKSAPTLDSTPLSAEWHGWSTGRRPRSGLTGTARTARGGRAPSGGRACTTATRAPSRTGTSCCSP